MPEQIVKGTARGKSVGRGSMLIVAAACAAWAGSAHGATDSWIAGSGDWATASNWNTDHVPAASDTANISDADSIDRTITYDYTGTAVTLIDLTVANSGGGTNTLLMNEAGTALTADVETIGGSGGGVVSQSQGDNRATNIYMAIDADDVGAYSLSDSASLTSGGELYVGYNGTASIVQSGGSNASGTLVLAYSSGSTGSYSLSGGTLSVGSGDEEIGVSGTGTFTQSGGSNASGTLVLAYSSGSNGSYSLSGGTLSVGSGGEQLGMGYQGTGTFTQSGGTNSAGPYLVLGASEGTAGTYNLSGGTAIVGNASTAGTLYVGEGGGVASGTLSVSGSGSLTVNNSSSTIGLIAAFGGSTLNFSGGTITTGELDLNESGSAQFNWTAGMLNLTDSVLEIDSLPGGSGATTMGYLSLGPGQVLSCSQGELIGVGPIESTLSQSGGANIITDGAGLDVSAGPTAAGVYTLSGGLLSCSGEEDIGDEGGLGSFIQTGGTNASVGEVLIGQGSNGTYSLSGSGTLDASGGLYLGGNSSVFDQRGGVCSIAPDLILGYNGENGTYNLSGGTVSSLAEIIGNTPENSAGSNGFLNQTGGTNTVVGGGLYIGSYSGSVGVYSLSGSGVVTVNGGVFVGGTAAGAGGDGSLSISGGQMAINGLLELWNSDGSQVNIAGGTFSAGATYNLALIEATAGTANLGAVTGSGSLQVGSTGTSGSPVSVTASALQQSAVNIASGGYLKLTGGGTSNQVNLLSISGNGVLDLTGTALTVNYAAEADPVATIEGYLASGYNAGNWNGPGINSSSAAADHQYAVGYADSADPGNPAGLFPDTVEIKYTLYGDANLDGVVNSVDFGILAANFGESGKSWDQGAFTYNGTVNSVDFGLLAANFGKSASGADVEVSGADWAALDAFATANGLMSEVPEPVSGGLMLVGLMGAMSVRRRR